MRTDRVAREMLKSPDMKPIAFLVLLALGPALAELCMPASVIAAAASTAAPVPAGALTAPLARERAVLCGE
jgi:hypothetical protein